LSLIVLVIRIGIHSDLFSTVDMVPWLTRSRITTKRLNAHETQFDAGVSAAKGIRKGGRSFLWLGMRSMEAQPLILPM